MITAQVVETSVIVNNSPIQDYVHPDDHTQPTYEMSSWVQTFLKKGKSWSDAVNWPLFQL